MKKLMILLMVLLIALPALAETAEEPLAPFQISAPEGVSAEEPVGGTGLTFVHENGTTRVLAMVISRVPDAEGDHAAELRRLMVQFAPESRSGVPLTLTAGLHGLQAVTPNAMEGRNGAKPDQITVMVLWQTALRGELLILSGYDMDGDTLAVEELLSSLLSHTTVNGAPIMAE